jgi:hypothetical protein
MFHNVVDRSLLYKSKEVEDGIFGIDNVEVTYIGGNYCKDKLTHVKSNMGSIKTIKYNGQTGRIGNESFTLMFLNQTCHITFTIDTFHEETQTQLYVSIEADSTDEYNHILEKFKIMLKQAILNDWKMCTWVIDEQSEELGMKLYPHIYKTENKMRAFINKILTHKYGVKWMELFGLEDVRKGHERSHVDFKREVLEFNNINDFLICSTAESLSKLMLKSRIYDTGITLSESQSLQLHKMIYNGNEKGIYDTLLKARNVKVDLWEGVFKKYFDEDIHKYISNFIKNRNHIAHNKPITIAAFEKMSQNTVTLETMFDKANEIFKNEELSEELSETYDAENEAMELEQGYMYERIRNETGINILFYEDILNLFNDSTRDIYDTIDNSEYFTYSIEVSSYHKLENTTKDQVIFSIKSNVDERFSFDVMAKIEVNEGMSEDSYLRLWITTNEDKILLSKEILYHNGEAHEDLSECYFVLDTDSVFDEESIKDFIEELESYIQEDMNPIKYEADSLSYSAAKDGGNPPVAEIACWNCYQEYISIDNSLYPFGHCINCGEENELSVCIRCEKIYNTNEGSNDLCGSCFEKLEK